MLRLALLVLALLLAPGLAMADTVRVISSGGFLTALRALAPGFQAATGHQLDIAFGPSMGTTPDTVPARLARHEPIDALVLVGSALQKIAADGTATKVDVARSFMGAAVKAGTPVPDVSTAQALRAALLAAPSVAVSDSASGVFLVNEGFARLGIAEQMKPKTRVVQADPVGEVVARGDAAIGFQQVSELKPVPGLTLLGPLPPEVRLVTVYSAGVVAAAPHMAAAEALVAYLRSPAAVRAMRDSGLEAYQAKE